MNLIDDDIEYKEFTEEIKNRIFNHYEGKKEVRLSVVRKNNGVNLAGISCISEENNIAPTLYLESFYSDFCKGMDIEVITEKIINTLEEQSVLKQFDVKFFSEYEKVKDNIVFKIINKDKNQKLLEDVPYIECLDLAIVFYYMFNNEEIVDASILIYNSHLKMWNVTKEQLYDDAYNNAQRIMNPKIMNMNEVMNQIISNDLKRQYSDEEMTILAQNEDKSTKQWLEDKVNEFVYDMTGQNSESPMFVLTNCKQLYGAGCMIYKNLLADFAIRRNQNLYILPSSIHEVIIVPDINDIDENNLKQMVKEVNRTQVRYDEILSDSVYYFDRITQNLSLA